MVPLKEVFKEVSEFIGPNVMALETGTAFQFYPENYDNLSTLNISKYLLKNAPSKLISIDNDPEAIEKCKKELFKMELLGLVFHYCNESLYTLNGLNRDNEKFNFFWLDSGESAKHGLKEYEYAVQMLKKPGVICIDDYGAEGSVKWRESSEQLKKDATYWKEYKTATGLIVGYFE